MAAPIVGGAILGPAGSKLGSMVGNALEGEDELEDEVEGEQEMVHEIVTHPTTQNEALAEMLAEAAFNSTHEGEAEAMIGASVVTVLSPRDRRALRRLLPHLVKGSAALARILRHPHHRRARIGVKAVPAIMWQTAKSLKRQASKGKRITRRRAAITAARQVRRVLGSPKATVAAIRRNTKVSRQLRKPIGRIRGRVQRRRRVLG